VSNPPVTVQIRATSPRAGTDALVRAMASTPGVAKIVVTADAGQPESDTVQFEVAVSAANPVLRILRDSGLDREAPITVQDIDASITATRPVRRHRLIQRDQPPVWDLIEARIRSQARYAPSFYGLLLIAGLIAATGILTNSQILIVGAMVVGPEYNAIMGIALGLDQYDRSALVSGLLALAAGFAAAIVASLLFALCIRALGKTPHFYAVGVRPVSEFINSPSLYSVIVAVLAGVVGVVSLTQARAGALIGVFISVTTVPAAADIGLSAAYGSWHEVLGSVLQLLVNVVVLIVVGAAGLRAQRWLWRGRDAAPVPGTAP
jgi:uncharacterized hydrophobic protein (TIGR00271 family)